MSAGVYPSRRHERKSLIEIPPLVERALVTVNQSQLAKASGVSRETISRIVSGKIKRSRQETLQKLTRALQIQFLTDEEYRKLLMTKELAEVEALLFVFLQDAARTGLRIHELMVEKGMDIDELCVRAFGQDAWITAKRRPTQKKRRLIPKRKLVWRSPYREHLERIIFGQAYADLREISAIAKALGVLPQDLFVANPEGIEVFRELLRRSAYKNQKLNELLNRVRILLGIQL